jgi:hypothetical protein
MAEPIAPRGAWVTDFLRYHVLIRVFDGDANAWLAVIANKSMPDGERMFVEWISDRLQHDAQLLDRLRDVVEESGLWPPAPSHRSRRTPVSDME